MRLLPGGSTMKSNVRIVIFLTVLSIGPLLVLTQCKKRLVAETGIDVKPQDTVQAEVLEPTKPIIHERVAIPEEQDSTPEPKPIVQTHEKSAEEQDAMPESEPEHVALKSNQDQPETSENQEPPSLVQRFFMRLDQQFCNETKSPPTLTEYLTTLDRTVNEEALLKNMGDLLLAQKIGIDAQLISIPDDQRAQVTQELAQEMANLEERKKAVAQELFYLKTKIALYNCADQLNNKVEEAQQAQETSGVLADASVRIDEPSAQQVQKTKTVKALTQLSYALFELSSFPQMLSEKPAVDRTEMGLIGSDDPDAGDE